MVAIGPFPDRSHCSARPPRRPDVSSAGSRSTALAIQTSLGVLLTLGSIRLVPLLGSELGWRHVFLILVIGPVLGLGSMLRLRRLPEARAMAGGRR